MLFASSSKYVAFAAPIALVLPSHLLSVSVIISNPMLSAPAAYDRYSNTLDLLLAVLLAPGQAQGSLCRQADIPCYAWFGKFPHHLSLHLGF
jgi:hypothetical protein